jgi:hypothetical protein
MTVGSWAALAMGCSDPPPSSDGIDPPAPSAPNPTVPPEAHLERTSPEPIESTGTVEGVRWEDGFVVETVVGETYVSFRPDGTSAETSEGAPEPRAIELPDERYALASTSDAAGEVVLATHPVYASTERPRTIGVGPPGVDETIRIGPDLVDRELWVHRVGHAPRRLVQGDAAGGHAAVLIVDRDVVVARSTATSRWVSRYAPNGTVRWRHPLPEPVSAPRLGAANGRVVVATASDVVSVTSVASDGTLGPTARVENERTAQTDHYELVSCGATVSLIVVSHDRDGRQIETTRYPIDAQGSLGVATVLASARLVGEPTARVPRPWQHELLSACGPDRAAILFVAQVAPNREGFVLAEWSLAGELTEPARR